MKVFLYARWSSLEQGRGSTLERQLDLCRSYCENRDWTDIEVVKDEGRSAYTGANLSQGNLGKLTERLEQGLIPYGSVLLVEQLDRISRRPPMEVMNWISRVVNAGLTIITVNDNQEISKAELERNQLGIVSLVFNSYRAYSESKHKSERLGDSWRLKREKLERGEPIKKSAICPAWLKLDHATNSFEKIEDRVAIVQRIFDLSESGVGKERIAEMLNDAGEPTWREYAKDDPNGRYKKGDKIAIKWHASYIQKILTSPTVMGEYQPHVKGRADSKRRPVGEPIPGYYPRIIEPAQFARVNKRRPAAKGRKGQVSNLFSGLARCAECGGTVIYRNKQSAGAKKLNREGKRVWTVSSDQTYLACGNYKGQTRCTNKHFIRYRPLRDAVLDAVLYLALQDSFFAQPEEVGAIERNLGDKKRGHELLQARATRYLKAMGDDEDPDIKREWQEARAAAKAVHNEVKSLENELVLARGRVSPAEHLKRVGNVRAAIDADDPQERLEARHRVMGALKEIITTMLLMPDRTVRVILLGGAHAIDFDDKGKRIREASVLPQLADGDEQMMRGVTNVQLGTIDDEVNQREAQRMVEQVITRHKKRAK